MSDNNDTQKTSKDDDVKVTYLYLCDGHACEHPTMCYLNRDKNEGPYCYHTHDENHSLVNHVVPFLKTRFSLVREDDGEVVFMEHLVTNDKLNLLKMLLEQVEKAKNESKEDE